MFLFHRCQEDQGCCFPCSISQVIFLKTLWINTTYNPVGGIHLLRHLSFASAQLVRLKSFFAKKASCLAFICTFVHCLPIVATRFSEEDGAAGCSTT